MPFPDNIFKCIIPIHQSTPVSASIYGIFVVWSRYEVSARADPKQLYMVGHAGTDFASSAMLSSFNTYFGFGIALATNSAMGLDCSRDQPAFQTEGDHGSITACLVLDAVVRLYGHEGLNCETIGGRSAGAAVHRTHRRSHTRAPGRRKPAAGLPPALRELDSSGTPATCTWTELWGGECEVCATEPCVSCEQTCSSAAECASCQHSHPWTHDGALSWAGTMPCGDMCRVSAGRCAGGALPHNSSLVWSGGTVTFFSDGACAVPAGQPWTVSGDCNTSLAPGEPFPSAPIPLGHLALGCNGTHATVVFGASRKSCDDARVGWLEGRILPAAGARQCVAVPPGSGGRRLHFVAACA